MFDVLDRRKIFSIHEIFSVIIIEFIFLPEHGMQPTNTQIQLTKEYYYGDTLLGKEVFFGITEVTYPDPEHFHYPITITRRFEGRVEHRWKVESILKVSDVTLRINVTPRSTKVVEEYLRQTAKKNKSVIGQLGKGNLVEVEFGHIHSSRSLDGVSKSTKRYPDHIQNGEMHKRRLAIVIKVSPSRVQVVPISSRPPDLSNLSIFQLNQESTSELLDYNNIEKNSYAICDMIETVSLSRILPPLSRAKRSSALTRNVRYPYRLNREDMKKLTLALASSIGLKDYHSNQQKLKESYVDKIALTSKVDLLEEKRSELEVENTHLMDKLKLFDAMRYKLEEFYRGCYGDKDLEEIQDLIALELEEYKAILTDES